MISVLQDGVKKMALNIGSLETLGDLIGVKMEHSDSLEELITLILKETALGLCLLILGQTILEMKQSWLLKIKCLKATYRRKGTPAEGSHQS